MIARHITGYVVGWHGMRLGGIGTEGACVVM
jgi:hypothetical protein